MFFFWTEIKHYKFSLNIIALHCFKWRVEWMGKDLEEGQGRLEQPWKFYL